jgi:hypothetical protein
MLLENGTKNNLEKKMRVHELINALADANPFAEVYFYHYDEYGEPAWLSVDVVDEYSNRIEMYEWI